MPSPLNERMNLVKDTLAQVAPERVVSRNFKDFGQHAIEDLKKGVLTVISKAETEYANSFHRHAETSKHRLIITGQIALGNNATGEQIEDAEFLMVEDVKALVRSSLPVDICTLEMKSFRQSGQLDAPNGWVVCELELDELRGQL